MPEFEAEEQKRIIKEAINEWLDKQFTKLGKWTLGGICSMGLAAITYWFLTSSGWHR